MKKRIITRLLSFTLLLFFLSSCTVGTSEVKTTSKDYFPKVGGLDLQGNDQTFPECLEKDQTICVVAYQRWQQEWVDEWYAEIEKVVSKNSESFAYYEIPTISKLSAPVRWWIYRGMRGGITSEKMRSQVITLHIDKKPFNKHLEIIDEEIVYVFVLDKEGKILYRDQGRFSDEKWLKLANYLEQK